MAKMMNPELEVVRFESEDLIATSSGSHTLSYIDGKGWSLDNKGYGTLNELVEAITGKEYSAINNGSDIILSNGGENKLSEVFDNLNGNHNYYGDNTTWTAQ